MALLFLAFVVQSHLPHSLNILKKYTKFFWLQTMICTELDEVYMNGVLIHATRLL